MFTFKGISSKEMRIIVEEPDNLIAKAPIKHEILNIEGRDDAIYYPLGRSPIEISLTLQLLDPSKVDQVLMWLDGEGELIYKDRKTKARIFSEVQPIRTSGIRLINIDIVRAPFWNITDDVFVQEQAGILIDKKFEGFTISNQDLINKINLVNGLYTIEMEIKNIGDANLVVDLDQLGNIVLKPNEQKKIKRYGEVTKRSVTIRFSSSESVDFIAYKPLLYKGTKEPSGMVVGEKYIDNIGTIYSQPIIKLTKETQNIVEFLVGGVQFEYDFAGEDHVLIDCVEMNATRNGVSRNSKLKIGFEFPKLQPGYNKVTTIKGDAKIEFKRKDRWL